VKQDPARDHEEHTMRIVIFGANGPTGRLLTRLSLTAGYDTVAVTRQPGTFPLQDPLLRVAGADVLDADAVDSLVEGSDAVLSALGVPFGKAPVEVYSRGAEHMLDAMKRHDVRRLVVVSSGAVTGEDEPTGGFLFNRVLQPYVTKRLGKTVYDDMRRMEDLVSRSDADWTILRPSGLYELPEVTDYSLTEEHGPGRFTARIDLAAAILRQVTDDRFVRRTGHVITTRDNPGLLSMMLREAFGK
jgi:nucleoside-diphosphate-sugar epimerase